MPEKKQINVPYHPDKRLDNWMEGEFTRCTTPTLWHESNRQWHPWVDQFPDLKNIIKRYQRWYEIGCHPKRFGMKNLLDEHEPRIRQRLSWKVRNKEFIPTGWNIISKKALESDHVIQYLFNILYNGCYSGKVDFVSSQKEIEEFYRLTKIQIDINRRTIQHKYPHLQNSRFPHQTFWAWFSCEMSTRRVVSKLRLYDLLDGHPWK